MIEFLEHLQRHIPGKLLVIWYGGPIHRSRLVRDYLDNLKGKIWVGPLLHLHLIKTVAIANGSGVREDGAAGQGNIGDDRSPGLQIG